MSEELKKHNPVDAMIDAMQDMKEVTHAVMIVACENKDGYAVEIRGEALPDWVVKGLLTEALDGLRVLSESHGGTIREVS